MEISGESKWVKLKAVEATPESFGEYGQVVEASPDGDVFGPSDAQLDLSHGVPRFYIMNLQGRPLKFSTITHHASVTQCLGSIGGHVWYLGVAKPSIVESKDSEGNNVVQSHCASGHFYVPPAVADVRVFKITGPKFLKLNIGTWHAGPLFRAGTMDFYNLELSDTNVSFGLSSNSFNYAFAGLVEKLACNREYVSMFLTPVTWSPVGHYRNMGRYLGDSRDFPVGLGKTGNGTPLRQPFFVAGG